MSNLLNCFECECSLHLLGATFSLHQLKVVEVVYIFQESMMHGSIENGYHMIDIWENFVTGLFQII